MKGRFTPAFLVATLTAMLIAPWLIAWALTPPGHIYTGHYAGGEDYGSYLSKIRQGWEGYWSWQDRMSAEDTGRRPLFLFYLALGHVARALRLPPERLPLVFYAAGSMMMPVAMGAVLALVGRAIADDQTRGRALWLAATASSPGILIPSLSAAEFYPAPHLYQAILFPHYLIDITGIATAMVLLLDQTRVPRRWRPLAGAAAMGAVSLVHPHVAGMALIAMGLYAMSLPPEQRTRAVLFLVPAGLAALPYTAYVAWLWATDPIVAAWREQARAGPLPLWQQPIWFGVASLLALWEAPRAWRQGGAQRLAVCWLVAAVALANSRILKGSGEFALGLSIPVGILAATAIVRLQRPWQSRAFVLSQFGFVVVLTAMLTTVLLRSEAPGRMYIAPDRVAAMRLATELAADTPALAPPHLAAQMVWLTGARVVWGHDVETPNSSRVYEMARNLYEGRLKEDDAKAFLQQNGVRVVVVDAAPPWPILPRETPWKPRLLDQYSFLRSVSNSNITVLVRS